MTSLIINKVSSSELREANNLIFGIWDSIEQAEYQLRMHGSSDDPNFVCACWDAIRLIKEYGVTK